MEKQTQKEQVDPNVIRITPGTYVEKAIERIEEAFKTYDKVILSAINSGIPNLVLIAEITKVKIADLHQLNSIETLKTSNKDHDGNNFEGREKISTRFKVELSKTKPTVTQGSFYKAPYSKDQIDEITSVKTDDSNIGE